MKIRGVRDAESEREGVRYGNRYLLRWEGKQEGIRAKTNSWSIEAKIGIWAVNQNAADIENW